MDDRDQLKEFASKIGRDVSDEELEEYFANPETQDLDFPEEEAPSPEQSDQPNTDSVAEEFSEAPDEPDAENDEEPPRDHEQV